MYISQARQRYENIWISNPFWKWGLVKIWDDPWQSSNQGPLEPQPSFRELSCRMREISISSFTTYSFLIIIGVRCTHAVLRISACTLYSLANTNGTIPWGRAACAEYWQVKRHVCLWIPHYFCCQLGVEWTIQMKRTRMYLYYGHLQQSSTHPDCIGRDHHQGWS
jgi:hypothetical protein